IDGEAVFVEDTFVLADPERRKGAADRRISGAQRNQFGGARRWREAKRDAQSESDEFQTQATHGFTSFEFNITRSLLGGTGAVMAGFIYHSIGASYIKIPCAVLGSHFFLVGGVLLCYGIGSLKLWLPVLEIDP